MLRRTIRVTGLASRGAIAAMTGYLGLLTVAATGAARQRDRIDLLRTPTHRIAVLIPAHDEELLIGSTLASLTAVDYPDRLVSVHVVADNCTDRTVEIAEAAGVDVHVRTDAENPGKGPALGWLIDRLRQRGEDIEAFAFVDADTTVSPQFLRAAEAMLAKGATVVQGHYAVREPGQSPVVAFRAAAMAARTYLRPLGRMAIGGSAGLYGNGMVFRADVMNERRWSSHLTEDVELHLELLLDGTLVAFAPNALVEAEMPATVAASQSQNERWERGRIEMVRRYVPTLLRKAVTGGPASRRAYADAVFDQAIPPFSVVVAGVAAWGGTAGLRALVPIAGRRRLGDVTAAAAVTATLAGYVLSALRLVGAPKAVYRSLLQAPRLGAWKIGLWLRMLVRPSSVSWLRTARN
jgi:1,2-diacylglycerol 3-beta-glucosyltransferase